MDIKDKEKMRVVIEIADALSNQGLVEESVSVLQESLGFARGITNKVDKCRALQFIAVGLSKRGLVEESVSVL